MGSGVALLFSKRGVLAPCSGAARVQNAPVRAHRFGRRGACVPVPFGLWAIGARAYMGTVPRARAGSWAPRSGVETLANKALCEERRIY